MDVQLVNGRSRFHLFAIPCILQVIFRVFLERDEPEVSQLAIRVLGEASSEPLVGKFMRTICCVFAAFSHGHTFVLSLMDVAAYMHGTEHTVVDNACGVHRTVEEEAEPMQHIHAL